MINVKTFSLSIGLIVRTKCSFADIDDCAGITCKNGGSCEDGINSYNCQCLDGYSGPMCEISKYFSVLNDIDITILKSSLREICTFLLEHLCLLRPSSDRNK